MFSKGWQALFILIMSVFFVACSTQIPTWRSKTAPLIEELVHLDASAFFPQEYRSLLETYEHGEALYQVRKDDKGADIYYQLAFQKAEMLKSGIKQEQKRREDAKKQQLAELVAKAEQEQLMRAAAEAEIRLRAKQFVQSSEVVRTENKKNREPSPRLPNYYTVRRGETLPQISARTEIYNDSTIWPIIYRANRDQIRDPKRLWPGQVLIIPRNFSRNEAIDARRYSNKTN